MNFKKYFQELKRRHVVKAGLAYLVVAWLIVQVLSIIIPAFGLSTSLLKTGIIILTIGFPIWLIFSWVYDLTPEGFKKTEDAEFDEEFSAKKNVKLNRIIIGALSVAVILLVYNQFRLKDSYQAEIAAVSKVDNRKSVAVLPFTNLSTDEENTFFTAGVHEDVLNKLSGINNLRVISRTSVMKYRDYEGSLSEVGFRLNVKYIVEGTVQRSNNQVRVTAKLINAETDESLWSNNYDRTLENVFSLQNDIAQEIVKTLETKISEQEDKNLNEIPTRDINAYDNYLKARTILNASNYNNEQLIQAIGFLNTAIKFDPNFIQARSALSLALTDVYYFKSNFGEDKDEIGVAKLKAQEALNDVIRLSPESHYRYKEEGYYHYVVEKDPIAALQNFDKAIVLFPNDAETLGLQAQIYQELGQLDKMVLNLEKAYAIDNTNARTAYFLTFGYEFTNQYDKLVPYLERLLELEPEKTHYEIQAKYYQFLHDGKLESYMAYETAVKTVKTTTIRDDRSVLNNEMTVAMFNNNFELYSKAYMGKWDTHQKGHGDWACPMIDNDDINLANLLIQHDKHDDAQEIIEGAKNRITRPYQKNGFCIFNKSTYNPKLEYLIGNKEVARREFDSIVPEILNNDLFPRGPVERGVLLQTADMVAPDQVYMIYKQITSKPVTFITMESVCANPWMYPNLIKDPNFIKEIKEDGRFVAFLKHYKLLSES